MIRISGGVRCGEGVMGLRWDENRWLFGYYNSQQKIKSKKSGKFWLLGVEGGGNRGGYKWREI